LITDPPDGRLPPMTPGGLARRAASEAALNGVPSGPEDRLLQERCITYGSPRLVAGYARGHVRVRLHEGNYGLPATLRGARAQERATGTGTQSK
jgi:hypothetical protein